jgi:transcriptional regulator with XRE-family HTH domain|nr:MAG TPA_asm: Repressor protein CI [Caudoviricetes sp.]
MKENTSQRLKRLMEYYNITQTDICKKTNIPKSSMSMYISGEREPRQDKLTLIAEAYDVNEAWLMGYEVEMKKGNAYSDEQAVRLATYFKKFQDILKKYDNLTDENKKSVNDMINFLSEQQTKKGL